MRFTYSLKVRKDGRNRIGRDCVPRSAFKEHLNERREIKSGPLESPCWLWTGSKNPRGYGTVMFQRKAKRVHRVAWMLYKGSIPEKMEVCHKCDTPACFNPEHLFLGTHTDNMRDAFSKGRIPARLGELHGRAKLRNEDVIKIRSLFGTMTSKAISEEFGVSRASIYMIRSGKTWKHLL